MNRYDWGWDRSYDWSFRRHPPRGYGFDPRRNAGWQADPEGSWSWGPGGDGRWENAQGRRARGGYDRGVYGNPYPTYGGYPGSGERGMYYGYRVGPGPFGGQNRGYRGGRMPGGHGQVFGRASGQTSPGRPREARYDRGFVQEPFLPESAHARYPELDQRHNHLDERWPTDASSEFDIAADDDEIRQAVRQNLVDDGWVKADRIQVEVVDRVVTLKGDVDDYLEARYAWDDAWEAEGVRGVINQLTVRTDAPQASGGKKGKK